MIGTLPSGGFRSITQAGRSSRSMVTVACGRPFSASTIRVRAQNGQRGAS
jgi:hypothetical protein